MKDLGDGLLPEVENVIKLAANDKMRKVTKRFERKAIAHFVLDQRPFRRYFCERVRMDPLFIRPDQLLVDEAERRLPHRNLGTPFHRQAAHL